MKRKLGLLSGAGISQESGLQTFRDADGLWEGHHPSEVATPEAWQQNPEMVLRFYNERRRQLAEVQPNKAHELFAELEEDFDVSIITQNVDDLHERAGSSKVLHLHGELTKVRAESGQGTEIDIGYKDIKLEQKAEDGSQLRPAIVWFGEAVPMMGEAIRLVKEVDFLFIVGTSLQVYPAAGLVDYTKPSCRGYLVEPQEPSSFLPTGVELIKETAVTSVPVIRKLLEL